MPLLSNFDGAEVTDGDAAVDSLIAQVSRPVRWDLCMETLVQRGVTGVIELAPAGTLAGLAKRGMPGVKTVTVKTPDDLSARPGPIRRTGGRGMSVPTLKQAPVQENTRILAVGAYRPEVIVTNDDVCQWIDSSDEWIRQRTGIITRHRAPADVSVIDMAEGAAREALAEGRHRGLPAGRRHRLHRHPPLRHPVRRREPGRPARCDAGSGVRHLRRLRRVLLRHCPGRRPGPLRGGQVRPGGRRRKALRRHRQHANGPFPSSSATAPAPS